MDMKKIIALLLVGIVAYFVLKNGTESKDTKGAGQKSKDKPSASCTSKANCKHKCMDYDGCNCNIDKVCMHLEDIKQKEQDYEGMDDYYDGLYGRFKNIKLH